MRNKYNSLPNQSSEQARLPILKRANKLIAAAAISGTLVSTTAAEASTKSADPLTGGAEAGQLRTPEQQVKRNAVKISKHLTKVFEQNKGKNLTAPMSATVDRSEPNGTKHISIESISNADEKFPTGPYTYFYAGINTKFKNGTPDPRKVQNFEILQEIVTPAEGTSYPRPIISRAEQYYVSFSKNKQGEWKVQERVADPEAGQTNTNLNTGRHFNQEELAEITNGALEMLIYHLPLKGQTGGTPAPEQ